MIHTIRLILKTVECIYRNGQIEFTKPPEDVNNSTQVLITFLDSNQIDPLKLRQLIEHLETIAGIQQGFEELNAGKTRPIEDFIKRMQEKYDISS